MHVCMNLPASCRPSYTPVAAQFAEETGIRVVQEANEDESYENMCHVLYHFLQVGCVPRKILKSPKSTQKVYYYIRLFA